LENNVLLYVRSEKVFTIKHGQMPAVHTGWWVDSYCALPMATQVTYKHKQEDDEAVNLLKEAGIAYRLVDLSNCSLIVWLKAKMSGINEKPTLILNHKKITGIENIKKFLQELNPKK